MNKFSIYTTIDGLGGHAMPGNSGWVHGRLVKGKWCPIEYSSRKTAQKALNGPQFHGQGAYATDGKSTLYPRD